MPPTCYLSPFPPFLFHVSHFLYFRLHNDPKSLLQKCGGCHSSWQFLLLSSLFFISSCFWSMRFHCYSYCKWPCDGAPEALLNRGFVFTHVPSSTLRQYQLQKTHSADLLATQHLLPDSLSLPFEKGDRPHSAGMMLCRPCGWVLVHSSLLAVLLLH